MIFSFRVEPKINMCCDFHNSGKVGQGSWRGKNFAKREFFQLGTGYVFEDCFDLFFISFNHFNSSPRITAIYQTAKLSFSSASLNICTHLIGFICLNLKVKPQTLFNLRNTDKMAPAGELYTKVIQCPFNKHPELKAFL